jgi:hypothetical protein
VNRIADISIFESIQGKAHQMMGFSSLSVFNATFTIEDKKKAKERARDIERRKLDFAREEKFLSDTDSQYKKLKDLEKSGKASRRDITDLADLRGKRIGSRSNIEHGIKELKGWGVIVTSTKLNDD